ncbi:MAG TPA: SulP family inorganic anion transporter [Myxococcota bacterium]|nr:SulP family inorganic anion transporter [Myxococcota bacterium]
MTKRGRETRPPGVTGWMLSVLPAFDSLRGYTSRDARADLAAGLTVASVAVPQAMAYGMVAGVPPAHGLYTAIVMTAIGAISTSSRQLINGPTNVISIAVLSAIAAIPAEDKVHAAVVMAALVGAVQLLITLLRLGDLERYISHSVVVGFTLGAGSLLVLDQLKNLLGLTAQGAADEHFIVKFWHTMMEGGPIHPATAAIGASSIAMILALRALKERLGWRLLPDLLLVVIAHAGLVAWLHLDAEGVRVVGDIPASLPAFRLPDLRAPWVQDLAYSAMAIATLGLLEAIAMSKAIAAQTGQKLDINQQCLSEGLANLGGSFFQCIPGSGSLTRSSINQQAGAASQWAGMWSAVAVALIILVFAPYARLIPKATLAGILIVSSWRMIDPPAQLYHLRATRFDRMIVLATAFSAVFVSVEFCVLIGVFMSFLLTVPRVGRMLLTEFVVGEDGLIHERMPDEPVCCRMRIFGLEGEMFFGSAASLEAHMDDIEASLAGQTEVVILRMKRVRSPDAVCLSLLERHLARLDQAGIHVLMCGVREDLRRGLERTGILDRMHHEQVFIEQPVRGSSTLLAVAAARDLLAQTACETCSLRRFGTGGPMSGVIG